MIWYVRPIGPVSSFGRSITAAPSASGSIERYPVKRTCRVCGLGLMEPASAR